MPRFIKAAFPALAALLLGGAAPAYTDDTLNNNLTPEALQRSLAENLPPGWQISAPATDLGKWQATISVPPRWVGNPVAAAIKLCPSSDSDIWKAMPSLALIVHYRGRDWPEYDCAP
jgi:hypothetical protein